MPCSDKFGSSTNCSSRTSCLRSLLSLIRVGARVALQLTPKPSLSVASRLMPLLAEDAGTTVRAGVYRLLRHLVVDQHDVYALQGRYLDLFLTRSVTLPVARSLALTVRPSPHASSLPSWPPPQPQLSLTRPPLSAGEGASPPPHSPTALPPRLGRRGRRAPSDPLFRHSSGGRHCRERGREDADHVSRDFGRAS